MKKLILSEIQDAMNSFPRWKLEIDANEIPEIGNQIDKALHWIDQVYKETHGNVEIIFTLCAWRNGQLKKDLKNLIFAGKPYLEKVKVS